MKTTDEFIHFFMNNRSNLSMKERVVDLIFHARAMLASAMRIAFFSVRNT